MDEAAIADIFAAFGPVRCRRMFGGLGLYADGLMFGLVVRDHIYLKTDGDFARALEMRGAEPFVYEARGRKVTLSYWMLPEAALDDTEDAAELARTALGIARRAAGDTPPGTRKPRAKQSRRERIPGQDIT
ncbi:TfoX/Sxy family protein [Ancylobacter pratisalsi]|uniref:TfoX/Sxy family protein n=1 Tax=Ancylobacter pratisalsi TaxID=1745854 RepID=A0A6P1YH28_9HYPH|nr:TfoX/Sxy family protein [Ancylobacter pratisalsi]QIB32462.1 TfoX/Sxy family protein [Ancylobacter pratisalsi]